MTAHSCEKSMPQLPEISGFKLIAEMLRTPRSILYRARRLVENDIVVLKVFRRNLCDRHFIEKLSRKAEAAFLLDHSGLVKSLGCITGQALVQADAVLKNTPELPAEKIAVEKVELKSDDPIFLVAEWVSGDSIARLLKDGKAFQASRALLTTLQCANALQFAAAHKCFHGRLHPSDIVLGGSSACLLGVGLGERPEHPAWEVKDTYLFEPLIYTSNEAMPSQPFPNRTSQLAAADIYQLGSILFHMLTGIPPFKGRDEASLLEERAELKKPVHWPAKMNLPDEAIRVTEKMMAPLSTDRPRYEDLIPLLTDALFSAEKSETALRVAQAASSPQFSKAGASPLALPLPNDILSTAANHALHEYSGEKSPQTVCAKGGYEPIKSDIRHPSTPPGSATVFQRDTKKNNAALAWALVALTVIVFMGAVVSIVFYSPGAKGPTSTPIATSPDNQNQEPLPQAIARKPNPSAGLAPTPTTLSSTLPTPAAGGSGTAVGLGNTADTASAVKEFELIEAMLKRGDVTHTPALLRVVKVVAEHAGSDTTTRVKALLLAAQIEETLIKNIAASAGAEKIAIQELSLEKAKDIATKTAAAKKLEDDKQNAAKEQDVKLAAFSISLKDAQEKVAKFQYGDALEVLDKLVLDDELKKISTAMIEIIKIEQDFFMRCRKNLIEQIERNSKKESPLQVFPRKNDPMGDDIIDFDAKGLVIQSKKGRTVSKTVTEWKVVPPAQAMVMLQLLSKKDVEDQRALTVFAFHRNLTVQKEAALDSLSALPNGKEKAGVLSEIFNTLQARIFSSIPAEN